MTDPQTILEQARQGTVPANWRVFTKKRGKLSGLLRGSSHDPDPLLVITPDAAVEYRDASTTPEVVNFAELAAVDLKVRGQSFSDSTIVNISAWLDLRYRSGSKAKWRPASFGDGFQAIQGFLEAYGAHRAQRGG
ncbi:hypothetical protein GCM10010441_42480 [Kitasatospora paracochleata]|uniref:Uncharacterized protein n=1 Tax=Kitasatospora paracochleata TaxID=58354 RepID=A0ABT1J1C9_9ACTN|nr:hypothetical protein [Kitasatospora paracochleata]MCP2310964.1 hypothetical protein [Kitasatospora paracochleata]